MKSAISVVWGVFLALGVGLLIMFGIVWPIFMTFFDTELAWSRVIAGGVLIFVVAFSFYWGGMLAGYRAPSRRRLHGTLVAPAAFVISPILNLLTGQGLFPGLNSLWTVAGVIGVLAISTVTAHIGAHRSEALYAHNQEQLQKISRRNLNREREARRSQGRREGN